MSVTDVQQITIGALQGIGASTVFVLVLFIGFCVIVGFTKTKKTAGGGALETRAKEGIAALKSKNWTARRASLVEQISEIGELAIQWSAASRENQSLK